jgi:glycosyltransferase involved in cell wall biosynthesis
MPRPLRVLHCPFSVGSHPQGLAEAERSLGLDSVSVSFDELFEGIGRGRRELRRWGLFVRALREFDVVHFNFGSSISPRRFPETLTGGGVGRTLFGAYARAFELRDLQVLKRAGKVIFVTYQGDDARTAELAGGAAREAGYYDIEHDRRKRSWVATFDRHASGIYALNPDLLSVLPARAEFLPYASVDPDQWRPPTAEWEPGRLRIAHAPTHRGVKGTRFVLEAVQGLDAELDLVEGVGRHEARRRLERADVVVDQLLLGWYGGVAVEAMALGKPVVAYLRHEHLGVVPAEMRHDLPIVEARPETLRDVLRGLMGRDLDEIGRRGRHYVERWHDPRRIAKRLEADYRQAMRR